jgi:hypothetical protein
MRPTPVGTSSFETERACVARGRSLRCSFSAPEHRADAPADDLAAVTVDMTRAGAGRMAASMRRAGDPRRKWRRTHPDHARPWALPRRSAGAFPNRPSGFSPWPLGYSPDRGAGANHRRKTPAAFPHARPQALVGRRSVGRIPRCPVCRGASLAPGPAAAPPRGSVYQADNVVHVLSIHDPARFYASNMQSPHVRVALLRDLADVIDNVLAPVRE